MDYRKINSHIILLLIVFIVGLTVSMIGRRIVIEKGFDTGTANLTFLIILGVCIVVYLFILATLAHTIVPWVMKKIPSKKEVAAIIPDDISNEKEETQVQSIEDIRQSAEKVYIEKQNAKINLFLEYSHLTMAPYLADDELSRFDEYIQRYAREGVLPDDSKPVKATKLKNPDMYHFGWNMANYFGYDKQNVVPWLQQVFLNLQGLEPTTIKGKLYDKQTRKYIIPNIEDIPKYLDELNS